MADNSKKISITAKAIELNRSGWWMYFANYSFAFNTNIIQFRICMN